MRFRFPWRFAPMLLSMLACAAQAASPVLLNVSYDPTREFYRDFNAAFASTGRRITMASA